MRAPGAATHLEPRSRAAPIRRGRSWFGLAEHAGQQRRDHHPAQDQGRQAEDQHALDALVIVVVVVHGVGLPAAQHQSSTHKRQIEALVERAHCKSAPTAISLHAGSDLQAPPLI
jgi:hypothetical protein